VRQRNNAERVTLGSERYLRRDTRALTMTVRLSHGQRRVVAAREEYRVQRYVYADFATSLRVSRLSPTIIASCMNFAAL